MKVPMAFASQRAVMADFERFATTRFRPCHERAESDMQRPDT